MNDPTPHLGRFESYEQASREFRWLIPARFNIAGSLCHNHPDAVTRIALTEVKPGGANTYTFGGLDFLSDKFATVLSSTGVGAGDRVAVVLPQSAPLAIAHLGALKAGTVIVCLSMSADTASLLHALTDSGTKVVVAHQSLRRFIEECRNIPSLRSLLVVGDLRSNDASADSDFWSEVDQASSDFNAVETDAHSPALIFYPVVLGKHPAVVHSHASLISQLTGFQMCNNLEVDCDAVFWTAEEWCSVNQLLGLVYPAWWYGWSIVAIARPPVAVSSLFELYGVTNAFTVPSVLSALVEAKRQAGERLELKLRTIVNDGSILPDVREHASRSLGVAINEVRGHHRTGWIVGGCERWFSSPPGSSGRAVVGHTVEIIDDRGRVLPPGSTGRVAVHRSGPALLSEYKNATDPTAEECIGDWFVTGDFGHKNEDGDFYLSPS